MKKESCPFCTMQIVDTNSLETHNKPLISSENFIVTTGIGHFISGYLIIFHKDHILNFGELPKDQIQEFTDIKSRVRRILKDIYGVNPIIFEHGPSVRSSGGSCIDHAHMHVMPINLPSLPIQLINFFQVSQIASMTEYLHFSTKNLHYIYFETSEEQKYICWNDVIPCQYIRQIIAAQLGIAKQYNWRIHPFTENAEKTWNTIKEYMDYEVEI